VLEPLLETGELPNLARLRAEGAPAVLESTIPFHTGPAWASYATGSSPAAHGVFDFMVLRADDQLGVASQDDLQRPTYYQHLGAEGKRSVLINLPLDQDGCENAVIVNSWLTDDGARRMLPFGRQARYERLLDAYRTFPESIGSIDDLCDLEQARFDLARELFLAEDWDHFFVLFSSTDWAGHSLTGRFLQGDEAAAAALTRLYRQLDRHVGWLVDHANGATVTVMSDHGQCEETAVLRVNSLLLKLGLLTVQERDSYNPSQFYVDRHGHHRRLRLPLAVSRYRTNRFLRPPGLVAKRLMARGLGIDVVASVPRVDRARSKAFMPTDASFAVYLRNSDNGYPQHIREALAELTLPDGRPVLDGIWTVEELYGWPSSADGPFLLFSPALGVRPSAALKEPIVHISAAPGRGCHQRDGIVIFGGGQVRSGDLGRVSICDVAPTLLWSMGAGIPRGLDGRVVFEAFDPAFAADQPLNEVEPLLPNESTSSFDSEAGEVTSRLKALGYL
jgi:predicted AlkP superfamily phosphohydrolase/phosphomutase